MTLADVIDNTSQGLTNRNLVLQYWPFNCIVITIVNNDHRTFIVQATGHKVFMKLTYISLIFGDPQRILHPQLRPHTIHLFNIILYYYYGKNYLYFQVNRQD